MSDARTRVKAACDANQIFFLNGVSEDDVTAMIDEGVRVYSARSAVAAELGRKHTKRTMP